MVKYQTLFAASLLSLSTFAHADILSSHNTSTFCTPGFYAGVQGGHSETSYTTGEAFAGTIPPPAYSSSITFPGGGAIQNNNIVTTVTLNNPTVETSGIGGRIYAGYQFNPYFALEAGFTQYAKTPLHSQVTTLTQDNYTGIDDGDGYSGSSQTISTSNYDGAITENAIDVVAKGTLPLLYGFGLYVKAGAAYIAADRYINSNTSPGYTSTVSNDDNFGYQSSYSTNGNNFSTVLTKSYQAVHPVAGVGVNYTIPNSNISVDGSFTEIVGMGAIPTASLLALGLEYKFA